MSLPVPLSTLTTLAALVAPHGGQGTARRNAWSAMAEGSARARARREADLAMALAAAAARPTADRTAAAR